MEKNTGSPHAEEAQSAISNHEGNVGAFWIILRDGPMVLLRMRAEESSGD